MAAGLRLARELRLGHDGLGLGAPPRARGCGGGSSARSSGRRRKSPRSTSTLAGVYSAAAGWKIGYSRTARGPTSRTSSAARAAA